jgi:hypothetical protein
MFHSAASGNGDRSAAEIRTAVVIPLTGKEENVLIIEYRHQCHVTETGQPPRKRYTNRHRSWRSYAY